MIKTTKLSAYERFTIHPILVSRLAVQAFLFGDCWVVFSYTYISRIRYLVAFMYPETRECPLLLPPLASFVIQPHYIVLLSRTLFCSLSGSFFFFESKIAHSWSKCAHFHYRLSLWKGIYVESDILHFRLDHGLVLSKPIMKVKRS